MNPEDKTKMLTLLLKEGDYVYINGEKRIIGKKEGLTKFDILNLDGSLEEAAVDLSARKRKEPTSFILSRATKNSPNTNSNSYKNVRGHLESKEQDMLFLRDLEARMMDDYVGPIGTHVSWTPGAEDAEGTLEGFIMIISAFNGANGPSNGLFQRTLSGLDLNTLRKQVQVNEANEKSPIEIGTMVQFTDPLHGALMGKVESFNILVKGYNGTPHHFPQGFLFRVHGGPPEGGRRSRRSTKKGRKNRRRYSRRN